MNKVRRKKLHEIHKRITEQLDELQSVIDEEQDVYDNMPENLMYSERGETMSNNVEEMEQCHGEITFSLDELETNQIES